MGGHRLARGACVHRQPRTRLRNDLRVALRMLARDHDHVVAVEDGELDRFADRIAQAEQLVLRGDAQVEVAPHFVGEFEQPEPQLERAGVRIVAQQSLADQRAENAVQRRLGQCRGPQELAERHRRAVRGHDVEQAHGLLQHAEPGCRAEFSIRHRCPYCSRGLSFYRTDTRISQWMEHLTRKTH